MAIDQPCATEPRSTRPGEGADRKRRGSGVKQWLTRFTPDRHKIGEHKYLRIFGSLLQDPNLWHLNRRSAAGAFAVGLFVMYMPPVGQMLMAAAGAVAFRVNLPIAVTLVWITNPLTIPPMYYFAYLVGAWILGVEVMSFQMSFWLDWNNWLDLIAPLAVGCLVCATLCSAIGYLSVQAVWRWRLMRQIRLRRARYRAAISGVNLPSSKRHT